MMKPILITLLIASVLLNLFFILRMVPAKFGPGISVAHPDGKWIGHVDCLQELNPLHPDNGDECVTVSIENMQHAKQASIDARVTPQEDSDAAYLTESKENVRWVGDTLKVSVGHRFEITLTIPNSSEAGARRKEAERL